MSGIEVTGRRLAGRPWLGLTAGIAALGFSWSVAADDACREEAVPSRSFEITVSPADQRSRDAREADLFVTSVPGSGWRREGECVVQRTAEGPRFKRKVSVPSDGIYYYTSRANPADGPASAPEAEAPPQVRILVDTRPPLVELTAPASGQTLTAGQNARIEWRADDEHLDAAPVTLDYSPDNGQNWVAVAATQPGQGGLDWTVPADGTREILVRATAVDQAGNRASATTGRPLPVAAPDKAKPAQAEAAPAAPAGPAAPTTPAPPAEPAKPLTPATPNATQPAEANSANAEMDANAATPTFHDPTVMTASRAAWIAYLMAGNLVRRGALKDALRYYRTAVDCDPNFDEAWNDAGLIYKELGAYDRADECLQKALAIWPDNAAYYHNRGEILQAHGRSLLERNQGDEDLQRGIDTVHEAVRAYGQAIELAQKRGQLAGRAASFFRLGEICYYVNRDPEGARQYWRKVLMLHTPTPDLDTVIHDTGTPQIERTVEEYQRHTELAIGLETWQRWAPAYLTQLDQLERQGQAGGAPVPTGMAETPAAATPRAPATPAQPGWGEYYGTGYGAQADYSTTPPAVANYQAPAAAPVRTYVEPAPSTPAKVSGRFWPYERRR